MQRFKDILVFINGKAAERATLERAIALAKRNNAHLTVISAIKHAPRDAEMLATVMTPAEVESLVIQERHQYLEQFIAPIKQEGIPGTVKVLRGTPFLEIIREVIRSENDLVMITAEGKSRVTEMLFGSTSMHLMRKCPCPVWVVKPARRRLYTRILAAVDVSAEHDETLRLNDTIMQLAISMARLEHSELQVVHAWDAVSENTLRRAGRVPKSELDKVVRQSRTMYESWLDDLLKQDDLSDLPHEVHLVKGDAKKVIPKIARQKRVELIVMGTLSRSGVRGQFVGSTAEGILRQVDCSVLTVKPEGFVTPVTLDE